MSQPAADASVATALARTTTTSTFGPDAAISESLAACVAAADAMHSPVWQVRWIGLVWADQLLRAPAHGGELLQKECIPFAVSYELQPARLGMRSTGGAGCAVNNYAAAAAAEAEAKAAAGRRALVGARELVIVV